jgi:hypothetical protein
MRVTNRTSIAEPLFLAILRELPELENLQQLMNWALADERGRFAPGVITRVVVQDEFSHDVVVPWRDGLVLVYDTT